MFLPVIYGVCALTVESLSSSSLNNFRKVEDGCVDIYFYDWLYFGSYTSLLTFQLFNEGVRLPNQPYLQLL